MLKTAKNFDLLTSLFVLAGAVCALLLTHESLSYGLVAAVGLFAVCLVFLKTEYALFFFFCGILITTDGIPDAALGSSEYFYILEPDLKGLPSLLNVVIIVIASIYFARLYLIERKQSVIPMKYLLAWLFIDILAVMTAVSHGWTSADDLRLEFLKFFLPVVCFYVCVNALQDLQVVKRMIWILFAACFVKSSILDLYYLRGHGFPYAGFRIVSYDTAELMAFIVMILLTYQLVISGRLKGLARTLLLIGIEPMIFALIFSFRRAHWLGMAVSMAVMYYWSPKAERKRLVANIVKSLAVIVPVACVFLLLGTLSSGRMEKSVSMIGERLATLTNPKEGSNRHHLYEALQVIDDLSHQPFFGLGLTVPHTPVDETLGGWAEETQPLNIVHNTFLYVWMKLGLPGFLFFIWFGFKYCRMLFDYHRDYVETEITPYVTALGSSIGIWFTIFMTGPAPFYFHQTYLIALTAAIVLILMGHDRPGEATAMPDTDRRESPVPTQHPLRLETVDL